jgi:LuxR family maltose regulon positive regulatory protein
MQQVPLLQTKLYIPSLRSEFVSRPRLLERLNAGLPTRSKFLHTRAAFARLLTLVSAPAGYGKTTLLAEWVTRLRSDATHESLSVKGVGWLSLDEGDNDPTRFLTYLVAALQTIEARQGPAGNIGKGVLSVLQSPQPPPAQAVLTSLINEIAAIPDRSLLVLDDYHLIEAQAIHDAVVFLLEHLPPQMHVVVATREDPPLPLARLRAQGRLTELRASDLRFSSCEAAEFLNRVMGLNLSEQDISALERRTEGWIAGLQLASLALQGTLSMEGRQDTSSLIESFTGSHRYVMDYLVEEVLEQQPESVQAFLLQTAILDRLTGSLCDALTDQGNGQATLELLERANLFVVPLDDERRWYRYHRLFADLLRERSRKAHREQIPTLHRRASEWYERQGLLSDAIHHAGATKDFERVADLAELAWPGWALGSQSIAWLEPVKDLPEELVRARPVLSLAYAWASLNAGKLEDAEIKLKDVERWLEPPDATSDQPVASRSKASPERSRGMVVVDKEQFRTLPTWLATTRAYHAQATGDLQGTAKYVGRALDLFPEDDHYNRAAMTGLLGLAYWARGDLEAAHRTFSDGLFQNVHDLIKGAFVLVDMRMTLGHLHEAERACEHALQLARQYDPPMPLGTEDVYTGMSEVHRERGDLEAAAQDLAASKELGERVDLPDWQHRWCIAQAHLKESLGDLDGALHLLDEAERLYVRTPLPEVHPISAMRARIWIRQGRLVEAMGWARERGLSADDDLSYLRELEHITLARLLIAQYKRDRAGDSLNAAMRLLERLLNAAEEGKRTGSVMEILVLQALAREVQGNIPSALAPLERALTLAEPEGYVRLFVDEGPAMARLLYKALGRGIATGYVRRLLAAFPIAEPEPTGPSTAQARESDLIEPLSERELEVLQLIAEGLTNPEIAARLFLAVNTVKAHTRSMYGKLGVHSRTQAVARARALGILASV